MYKHTTYICVRVCTYMYVNNKKRGHEFAGQQGKTYGGFGLRKEK